MFFCLVAGCALTSGFSVETSRHASAIPLSDPGVVFEAIVQWGLVGTCRCEFLARKVPEGLASPSLPVWIESLFFVF